MDIRYLCKEVHYIAREKGFWDEPRNVGELLMLVVSELGEALEADRKNRHAIDLEYVIDAMRVPHDEGGERIFIDVFESHVKDTFEDELADVIIRIMDMIEAFYPGYYKEEDYHGVLDDGEITWAIETTNIGELLLRLTKKICNAYPGYTGNPIYSHIVGVMSLIIAKCTKHNIPIETYIDLKMQYNRTRERLHGKKY